MSQRVRVVRPDRNSNASRSRFQSPFPSDIALPSIAPRWRASSRPNAGPRAPPTRPEEVSTMPSNYRRFVPRLEVLAERALLDATASGGALFITGDDNPNTVVILDDGAGNVQVTLDGMA